jgi:hypothetical protein
VRTTGSAFQRRGSYSAATGFGAAMACALATVAEATAELGVWIEPGLERVSVI